MRPLVLESWRRSLEFGLDPDTEPPSDVRDDDLREYRDSHPLALAVPVIERLLIRHTIDSGLIVAIGDHSGRLLWVDGDRDLRRRAESMAFVEGSDWSERAVGTSAPGTALALGRSVQIRRDEHFNRIVHPWSCSAVPVHDRATGNLLGVIDITGRDDAIAPITLPLLEATVAAVEAELDLVRIGRLLTRPNTSLPRVGESPGQGAGFRPSSRHRGGGPDAHRATSSTTRPLPTERPPTLTILGREIGLLQIDQTATGLSTRHAEILTLLAWHPGGLTAQQLSQQIYGTPERVVNIRAEMVRLRRVLDPIGPTLTPMSRPYRLGAALDLDAQRLLAFLERGAHRVALACYTGPVLPSSLAPGITAIRNRVSSQLRTALLTDASVETLMEYAKTPEAMYDVELWHACLRLLPLRSPKRAIVVAHLEHIEADLT